MGESSASVERRHVRQFLEAITETLQTEDTRRLLQKCTSIRPGDKIIEIQRRVWEEVGWPEDVGRAAIGKLDKDNPEDAPLVELRDAFSSAVDSAFLRALEDRRPAKLETKAEMSRNDILDFLDAGHVILDTPQARDRLRKCVAETGAMPESVLNELHGEVMELIGFEREHGSQCLKRLGESGQFDNDRALAMRYGKWRGKTKSVCFALLNEYRKTGGELNVNDEARAKLLEMEAMEGLDAMTVEERTELLQKHGQRVGVFMKLPTEARQRHMERLPEQERLELAQAEILALTLLQFRQQQQQHEQVAGSSE